MNKSVSAVLFIIVFSTLSAHGQYFVYDFDTLVVTSSRIPTALSSTIRPLTVLNQSMIESSGAQTVAEALESTAGIDMQTRGPLGIQSDVSLRGAGFEQTLVLVDGIKLADPQTAHHNMDLPVNLADVERIEILKGSGSKLYGPNAFGGVINIITRKTLYPMTRVKVEAGDFGLYNGLVSLSLPMGNTTNQLSINKDHSNGYRHNTDFDKFNLFYKSTLKTGTADVSLTSGYTSKDFGANGFYSAKYPNQREDTQTLFLNANANLRKQRGWMSAGMSWRRHTDHYVLKYDNPSFYENNHVTDVYQAELQNTIDLRNFLHNVGVEIGQDNIQSNRLGDHWRSRCGFFYEGQTKTTGKLGLQVGTSAYYYSDWGWNFSPGIDISYQFNDKTRWSGSIGEAFRVPTFTELYYSSPIDQGNPHLIPEKAWTLEQNLVHNTSSIQISSGLFYRKGSNLIDWVRISENELWQAQNIATINTVGFETTVSYSPCASPLASLIHHISISYNYIYNDKSSASYESEYLLNTLRNQLVLTVSPIELLGILQNWTIRYEDRITQNSYVLVDTYIMKCYGDLTISLYISNLFDSAYTDFTGIPMPGRWLRCGIEYNLKSRQK